MKNLGKKINLILDNKQYELKNLKYTFKNIV